MLKIPQEIKDLISRDALFVINHSGGKDSQAMTIQMSKIIPVDRLFVIHAHLPGVEWDGIVEHINNTAPGIKFEEVRAIKTFFEMVHHRQMWPSPDNRQCTSDLKRGPIEKAIRHELKRRDEYVIVNCMGMRAQESSGRAKLNTFKHSPRNSKAGREWYDWLPIHHLLETEVFDTIKGAGQEPHWAYGEGMSRLSCCFCIMASKSDLKIAAQLNPELYKKYIETEREIGHTMIMPTKKHGPKYLDEVIGGES